MKPLAVQPPCRATFVSSRTGRAAGAPCSAFRPPMNSGSNELPVTLKARVSRPSGDQTRAAAAECPSREHILKTLARGGRNKVGRRARVRGTQSQDAVRKLRKTKRRAARPRLGGPPRVSQWAHRHNSRIKETTDFLPASARSASVDCGHPGDSLERTADASSR